MDVNDTISAIISEIESYELPLIHVDMEKKIIYSKLFIVRVRDYCQATIHFSVLIRSDESALITIFLKEMKELSSQGRLKIGESYYPISTKNILWGEEAYNRHTKVLEESYLEEYKYDSMMDEENDDMCFTV